MIMYNDFKTFKILGKEVSLHTEELNEGCNNTVAEIDDKFYYLGNEISNIASAVFAWQDCNGRDLSNEELRKVFLENNLLSEAI